MSYALGRVRTSSAGNPITFSQIVLPGDAVIGLLLKVVGAVDRAGGAPDLGGLVFTQASTTQKAATTPEAGAEAWYLLNPVPGTYTVTIPNTGALTIFTTVVIAMGGTASLDGANGGNGTSTNPTPGAVTVTQRGGIGFAVAASGATTWAPSAQGGTVIANTDDGAHGGGEQYIVNPAVGSVTLNWTQGSDDWGAVAMFFKEVSPNKFENYHTFRSQSAGVMSIFGNG